MANPWEEYKESNEPWIEYDETMQREEAARSALAGAADIAGSALYGMGKQAIEGLSMIGGGGTPEGIEAAQAMTGALPDYQLGEDAQKLVQGISQKYQDLAPDVLKELINDFVTLGPSFGESVFQATGSPALAAGATVFPDAIEAVTALKGARAARKAGREAIQEIPEAAAKAADVAGEAAGKTMAAAQQARPSKRLIAESLKEGAGGKAGAGYDLTRYGAVTENPFEQAAMAQGWDDEIIGALKTATPTDKAALKEMTAIRKSGADNMLSKMENRPAKIAGESMLKRYNVVKKANKQAARAVGEASKNLKGVDVDTFDLVNDFADSLSTRLKVNLTPDGRIDFTNSIIEKNPTATRALSDLVELMGRGGKPDAARLHFMKKFIDDNVTYGKAKDGLAGETESIMKELRANINNTIRDVDPNYAAANDTYSETIQALDDFQGLMGKKVDLTSDRASESVGRNLRKVMSNYNVREGMLDSIADIERIARKNGGEFNDSILLQAGFAQKLDDMFGTVADTSMRGVQEGALKQAGRGDVVGAAGTMGAAAIKKVRRQTDEKAFKSMIDLLSNP